MSDQQDTNPKTCCRGFFRFHRSTLLIASLMLLPWLLVALPGRKTGGTSTTTGLTTEYLHGLPFAFLERQSVVNWRGNSGPCGPIVSQDTWSEDVWSEGLESTSIEERGFWSDSTRWPWIGEADAEAMRIRWWGLLADLSLLLVACWVLARIVESRLKKRASHFAFSLAELLTAICITGVFFAWITTEYRRATKENLAVDRLDLAINTGNGFIYGERGNGLPILVSELFDHRSYLPLLECHLFRPVEHVQIVLPNEPKGETLALLDAIRNVDFPLHFRGDINKHNLPILKGLNDLANAKQLNLSFAFDPEQDKQTGVYRYDINWDFKLILPEADQLVISLQPEIDQEKQLGIFAPMKHLKCLMVSNLNQKGANYLGAAGKDFHALKQLNIDFKFALAWDDASKAYWIDPDFKLKLPEAEETKVTMQLLSEFDQEKQLRQFSSIKNLKRLAILGLNEEGLAYLNSNKDDFPSAKQLEIRFKFEPEWDYQNGNNQYDIDLQFKLPLLGVEEIEIYLQSEFDQEKQLRMFAPMNRFKSLEIHGLNRAGATYLNSIAKDLPNEMRVEFKSKDERIELSFPTKPPRSGFGS